MRDLNKRLEVLAGRGRARGADDVLQAAQKAAAEAGATGAEANGADLVGDGTHDEIGGDLQVVPITLTEAPPRRRARRSAFAAAGIAALLAVGTLAVSSLLGSGGADSPEGAVRELASAVNNEDLLAAADVLSPEEVRTLHDSLQGASEKAAQLKLVDNASRPLAGIDLSVDKLELSSEDMADGYAKVTVTGGLISGSLHRAGLSQLLQDASAQDHAFGNDDEKGDADLAHINETLPTFVMTVRHDGRWYVSPAYTALEYLRVANHLPAADLGSGRAATLGADSPEQAVRAGLDAAATKNWSKLFGLVQPDELPLYDYRVALNQLIGDNTDGQEQFTIDSFSTTSDVHGDTAIVNVTGSGHFGENGSNTWEAAAKCATPSGFASVAPSVAGGDYIPPVQHVCITDDGFFASRFFLTGGSLDADRSSTPPQATVVQRNGRWYLSPAGTLLHQLDRSIAAVDSRTIYATLGLYNRIPPDGALTLGTPVTVKPTSFNRALVYTLSGKAGQTIIGDTGASTDGSQYSVSSAAVRLFAPDGTQVENGYDLSYSDPVTLPADGEYRLVIQSYGIDDVTITVWDASNAPAEVLNRHVTDSCGPACTSGKAGSEQCTTTIPQDASTPQTTIPLDATGCANPLPVQIAPKSEPGQSETSASTSVTTAP